MTYLAPEDRTKACRNYMGLDSVIGEPCSECGHHALVHPGVGGAEACVICEVQVFFNTERLKNA